MSVAGERDKMAPQLQELAWQNRNLERQVADLTKDAQQASQVGLLPYSRNNRFPTVRRGFHRQHLPEQTPAFMGAIQWAVGKYRLLHLTLHMKT